MKKWEYGRVYMRFTPDHLELHFQGKSIDFVPGRYYDLKEYALIKSDLQLLFDDYPLSNYFDPNLKKGEIIDYYMPRQPDTLFNLEGSLLQQLGLKGWEMCGVARTDGSQTLFFKREILLEN